MFGLRRPQRVDAIQAELPFSIPHSRVKNTKGCSSRSANLVCKAREKYHLNTQSNSFLVCFFFFFFREVIQILQDDGKLVQQSLKSSLTIICFSSSIHRSTVLKTWQHPLYYLLAQMTNWPAQKTCNY